MGQGSPAWEGHADLGRNQVRLAYVLNMDDLRRALVVLEKALEAYNNRNLK